MRKDFSWGCVVNGCSKIEQTLHLASGDATYVNVQRAVKEQHAYMALVYSILEYGAIVCDPYHHGDIALLNESNTVPPASLRVIIIQDIKDASPPCSLTWNCLASKVIDVTDNFSLHTEWLGGLGRGGWVGGGWCQPYLLSTSYNLRDQPNNVSTQNVSQTVASNIIDRSATNNSRCFTVPTASSNQFKNSFFIKTIIEWNQLNNLQVQAEITQEFSRPSCSLLSQ